MELPHIDKAASISTDNINRILKHIENSLSSLNKEQTKDNPQNEEDYIKKLDKFCQEAEEELKYLKKKREVLERNYLDLAEFFTFDIKRYSIEQMLADIKHFKIQFKQVQ